MEFYSALHSRGVACKIISTPRQISVGCGLSVRVENSGVDCAYRSLRQRNYCTFLGAFYFDGNSLTRVGR